MFIIEPKDIVEIVVFSAFQKTFSIVVVIVISPQVVMTVEISSVDHR